MVSDSPPRKTPATSPDGSQRSLLTRLSRFSMGLRSVLRGEIRATDATRELLRRAHVRIRRRRERELVTTLASRPAELLPEFSQLTPAELLKRFRDPSTRTFFEGMDDEATAVAQRNLFPTETEELFRLAMAIIETHRWRLLGFGEKEVGQSIDWHRDPLSGRDWPKMFHADIDLWHNDGSDIRVLWELNRLGHFLILGRAYAVTKDERFAAEFFDEIDSWCQQNPVGRGANWSCAIEVALRVMNVLAALMLFRRSPSLTEERLLMLLAMFQQHGEHIRRNLEYSYVATGNHYIANVAGLFWLGLMVPELRMASTWREWALAEMLREMDKQVTTSGADYEASTGYHHFVLQILLYSFILCRANKIKIPQSYWDKLHLMLVYLRSYLRPCGFAPLVGDADGGQAMPLVAHTCDDQSYLLSLGAVLFNDPALKISDAAVPQELLWLLGEQSVRDYGALAAGTNEPHSIAFPDVGTYILRSSDLYLLFNASGAGGNGRNAHGHNDSLSIEVSACGRAFLVDPGSFVYTADLRQRHLFRSTAYHSTIQVDDSEQNSTNERVPFLIGDEAHPKVLRWEAGSDRDLVSAEHEGYRLLTSPITHRRTIVFHKSERWWLVEDELLGSGEHLIEARFHFDSGLEVKTRRQNIVAGSDEIIGARLIICSLNFEAEPVLEPRFVSRDYGLKTASISVCWSGRFTGPQKFRWALVPVCSGEDEAARLAIIEY